MKDVDQLIGHLTTELLACTDRPNEATVVKLLDLVEDVINFVSNDLGWQLAFQRRGFQHMSKGERDLWWVQATKTQRIK